MLRRGVLLRVAFGRQMGIHFEIRRRATRSGYLPILFCALITSVAMAQVPQSQQLSSPINVMPLPATVAPGAGRLLVSQTFSVAIAGYNDLRLQRVAQRFLHDVSRATLTIHADHGSEPVQELGEDESYVLDVSSAGAKLTAPNPLGVMHGLASFL